MAVKALDGGESGKVLLATAAANRSQERFRRWALELQALSHSPYGNYLHYFFVSLRKWNARVAAGLSSMLGQAGIIISSTSGHFTSLEHLDPKEPVPTSPVDPRVRAIPASRWVDAFTSVNYELDYRPKKRGDLSEVLQLTYADGTVIDIDIRTICDNQEPALGQVFAHAQPGIGGRLFPLRMSRSSTPKLWRAKQAAIQKMVQENADFEFFVSLGLAGVMSVLPAGPVVGPAPAPPNPVHLPRRPAGGQPGSRPPAPPPAGGRPPQSTATTRPPTQPGSGAPRASTNPLAYIAAPGEVIGQVPAAQLPSRPYGSTGYGTAMEPQMVAMVQRRFPNTQFRFRTGRGNTGPDVEWVGGENPGFHIADFKPDSATGWKKFVSQARQWDGGKMAPKNQEFKAAIIMYQQDGTVFIGDVGTVGRTTTRINVGSRKPPARPGPRR